MALQGDLRGANPSLPLPNQAAVILALIEGEQSLSDIHAVIANTPHAFALKKTVRPELQSALQISWMFLRR